jgi:hypothetical protein
MQNWYLNHGSEYYLLSSKRPMSLPAGGEKVYVTGSTHDAIPSSDIAYRNAISKQHQLVEQVDRWYLNDLPVSMAIGLYVDGLLFL